ncbi:flagellar basal body rod protein FlgC [Rhodocaloribacter litoris]|uniref:flagellar basal body rod protein FlgC n=1 Tax=Rhodocaloribacter litoris TaxID=2558931 RepID=UPI001422F251|nr:flagellar basal body rod protein FlgC [Rhodocaloribacter litoris]QXD16037.1 flagellar basal body rod protein FlgC [Rhodocaloribacter litoris]GIV59765.1 MAG: flagellar basal-body rod protein FlgC [Rhodothermaceae bacterium]
MLINNRFFRVFRASARGLHAQRVALGTAAENIANAGTTRTENGTPYAIKRAVHQVAEADYRRFSDLLDRIEGEMAVRDARHLEGLSLRRRLPDIEIGPETEVAEAVRLRREYDPTHPHADADGYVHYPDVNIVEEMAMMISASRIYEANLSAVQTAKDMIKRTLEI